MIYKIKYNLNTTTTFDIFSNIVLVSFYRIITSIRQYYNKLKFSSIATVTRFKI